MLYILVFFLENVFDGHLLKTSYTRLSSLHWCASADSLFQNLTAKHNAALILHHCTFRSPRKATWLMQDQLHLRYLHFNTAFIEGWGIFTGSKRKLLVFPSDFN